MLKLRVTPKAESDLIGIWVCTYEEWGVDQADRYLNQLEGGMKQLINYPSLGADYTHVFPWYRSLQVEHHAVFYQVLDPEVVVVRVLYEDLDAPKRLLE